MGRYLWELISDTGVFGVASIGDNMSVTDIDSYDGGLPCQRQAQLFELRRRQWSCVSAGSHRIQTKRSHRASGKGRQACLFTAGFWSQITGSVLSAWLRCLFSPRSEEEPLRCISFWVQVLFYLMLTISKGRLAPLHTRHWFLFQHPSVQLFFNPYSSKPTPTPCFINRVYL